LNSYSRLHSRRPYTLQLISATIIYLIGDLFAQSVAPTPSPTAITSSPSDNAGKTSTYDPARTARALVIGSSAAIPGYHWFLYLARNFNYKSKVISIIVKVLINQVVFTPIFNSYFFGMQSLLSGATATEIVERIRHTVPKSWVNSWKLWPVVTAFSFAFVRVELRGLFAGESSSSWFPPRYENAREHYGWQFFPGVIAIGWQAYLSVLNQRAAKMEQEKSDGTRQQIEQTPVKA
jgi:protein Mpv17